MQALTTPLAVGVPAGLLLLREGRLTGPAGVNFVNHIDVRCAPVAMSSRLTPKIVPAFQGRRSRTAGSNQNVP